MGSNTISGTFDGFSAVTAEAVILRGRGRTLIPALMDPLWSFEPRSRDVKGTDPGALNLPVRLEEEEELHEIWAA